MIKVGEFDNFKKQMLYFPPPFLGRAWWEQVQHCVWLHAIELQNQSCLDWLCVDLQNTTKVTKQKINQGTEIFMRNVVLDVVREILQTYYIENSNSTAYFNITKLLHALEVSQNDVKYLHFKRNTLKNVLPNTFSL